MINLLQKINDTNTYSLDKYFENSYYKIVIIYNLTSYIHEKLFRLSESSFLRFIFLINNINLSLKSFLTMIIFHKR